jgi:hypothetical protein
VLRTLLVIPLGFSDFHQSKLLIPEKSFYLCFANYW